jgi:lysozyme
MILAVILAAGFMTYEWLTYRKVKFTRYPEFGIAIPEAYSIHGIDVSKYQSMIAWEEVQAMKVKKVQLGFAFIKATEGIGNTDPQFKRNWKKSKEAGIVRGAYHFFLATKDGRMQAENFIKCVDLEPGDLPPVLDIEELYGVRADSMRSRVNAWLLAVEKAYNVKPVIYTSASFYKNFLGHDFDEYPLWVAHYFVKEQPGVDEGWYFWQHNATGRINGIKARVDFNVFSGDSTSFQNLLLH